MRYLEAGRDSDGRVPNPQLHVITMLYRDAGTMTITSEVCLKILVVDKAFINKHSYEIMLNVCAYEYTPSLQLMQIRR